MSNISIEDFLKLEIRIGTVLSAEKVEGSEKLLKLILDFGEMGQRQILSGIQAFFPDHQVLVGKQLPVIVNLEPRKMAGLESQGMIMATDDENGIVLLQPEKLVKPGSQIR